MGISICRSVAFSVPALGIGRLLRRGFSSILIDVEEKDKTKFKKKPSKLWNL